MNIFILYRYLRNSFSRAYQHTQPDVIVFLGDLLDEGSKASKNEYLSYVDRFNNIFYETKFSKVKHSAIHLWLSMNLYLQKYIFESRQSDQKIWMLGYYDIA